MKKRGRPSRSRSTVHSQERGVSGAALEAEQLRIIGGSLRGRSLTYSGDPRTRPMKDRVREALFNLIGPAIRGKIALDLFAGTGALGLEAISRGADSAVLIERHIPSAQLIEKNACSLGIAERVRIVASDSFFWLRHDWQPGTQPLVVFCSPPYDLYVTEASRMEELIRDLIHRAPAESLIVIEADERFSIDSLPAASHWRVREYPPAVVAIGELPLPLESDPAPSGL
jgi:16S rRNA (guanine966-N2)-methyltransferase